ncbi:hypothetical protein [Leifsonia aquatica]|uniref:Uncharacterized protein n=1 Tax=Leifsonia aquatica TaxID=144185 RepID=A0A7W4UXB4_LEIAQ|nr:hypothetical protein [Leifsonia aquatica]MBB2968024.1 hypothetical protein [Leifsonia aquatica]
MTVADSVDQVSAEFADIVCSDPEWVAAEFEQIVSGLWDEAAPACTAASGSHSVRGPASGAARRGDGASRTLWSAEVRATTRSPPRRARQLVWLV